MYLHAVFKNNRYWWFQSSLLEDCPLLIKHNVEHATQASQTLEIYQISVLRHEFLFGNRTVPWFERVSITVFGPAELFVLKYQIVPCCQHEFRASNSQLNARVSKLDAIIVWRKHNLVSLHCLLTMFMPGQDQWIQPAVLPHGWRRCMHKLKVHGRSEKLLSMRTNVYICLPVCSSSLSILASPMLEFPTHQSSPRSY